MKTTHFRSALGTATLLLCFAASPAPAQSTVEGPDTLFLTWFNDPCTSIVAQWLEDGRPLPLIAGATDDIPALDTPKLDGITLDGDDADWRGRGLDAGFIAGDDGQVYADDDLTASATLAWDERGLLVLVQVRDNTADESDNPDALYAGDSVECFVSTGVGADQRYQVIIAPGKDADEPEPRSQHYDYRSDRESGDDPTYEYACKTTDDGYTLELLLPWSNLGVTPADHDAAAFQFYINDRDDEKDFKSIAWHPDRDANERPESMVALRLTDGASDSPVARAKVTRDGDQAQLAVWTDATLAGLNVQATCAGKVLGEATLQPHNGGAAATITLPPAPQDARWGTVHAQLDGVSIAYARPMRWMMVSPPDPVNVQLEPFVPRDKIASANAHPIDSDIKPFGDHTGIFVHRVNVPDGLQPGSEYVLRFGGIEGPALRFRTAPDKLDRPLVFAEGGDVGIGRNVAPLHDIAASWSPLFGLIGGDCAYANGRTPERWVTYLQLWRKHMVDPDGRLIPMLCAIGNHEVDGSFGQPRERAPFFLALFDGLYPEHTYATIDFGDYLSLVLLDSGHVTAHDGEQTGWLDKTLAKRKNRPHVFTAYHVPAYPSHRDFEGKYSELARQHWVPLFDKHGVDISFEHHDHTYKRTHTMTAGQPDPDGVLYVGDGAWGMSPRTVATPSERPYLVKAISASHVIRVTLDSHTRTLLAIDVEGNQIDQYPE